MGKVYAIANHKGGVGKTTTAYNAGDALARAGRRVLIVDLDQQGSLTISAGLNPDVLQVTIYDILKSVAFATRAKPALALASIVQPIHENFFIAPANANLAALDIEIVSASLRETILQRALAPIRASYDAILLDCPPNLGLIVLNALVAADEVIIPLQTDYLATKGMSKLLDTVEFVQDRLNPSLTYAGIILTLADERTGHSRDVINKAREDFQGKIRVFSEVIKMNVRVKESPIVAQSIMEYDPSGQPARAYTAMVKELLEHA